MKNILQSKKILNLCMASIVILFILTTSILMIEILNNENLEVTVQTSLYIGKKLKASSKANTQVIEEEVVELSIDEKAENNEVNNSVPTEYNGFPTVGKIEIPATGVSLPILDKVTVKGMEIAPCLLYKTGELNKNGNNLIVGHNYRNNTIFSNNKNLKLGDKIYIYSLDGIKKEYTIYSKFITTPEDITYIRRDTGDNAEITLSCCTDDDVDRIIILAKEEK